MPRESVMQEAGYDRWNGGGKPIMPTSQKQRTLFSNYVNELFTVLGTYAAYVFAKNEFAYDTILLRNVCDENRTPLCDHLWMKAPKFIPWNIREGDFIRVNGRINRYTRLDGSTDYTLYVFNLRRWPE